MLKCRHSLAVTGTCFYRSRCGIGAVIRLRAGRTGFRFPAVAVGFYLLHNAEIGSEAHSSYYSVAAGSKRPGLGLTTHLRLIPRLRMIGAALLLPLCVSSWHGQALLYVYDFKSNKCSCRNSRILYNSETSQEFIFSRYVICFMRCYFCMA
jgi:hypothetical protein